MIDETRFMTACEALLPTLRRVALSILFSDADAQDAVQQALFNAWNARGKAEPNNLKAWLTRIAVNECRNIQRKRRRVVPMAEPRGEDVPYTPPDPDLKEAVASLPDLLRLPLLLKYMEGYSEREVAKALGLSVSTVKNRLFRARNALRAALSEEAILE